MEYRTAIVDECDCVMYWCSDLSGEEINEIIDNHPEWWIRTIEVWSKDCERRLLASIKGKIR